MVHLWCSAASEWAYPAGEVRLIFFLFILTSRPSPANSMLLKSDQWRGESHHVVHGVRGAINFRNIPGSNIYALGQPTVDAIDEVVARVKGAHPAADRIVWITLREEPIVYVNGAPYCLRRERFSLRNVKGSSPSLVFRKSYFYFYFLIVNVVDYGGISASRLELLEEKLR